MKHLKEFYSFSHIEEGNDERTYSPKKIAVLALIKKEDDPSKILGVSRKYDKQDFGLPGGKVDEGEDIYTAMVREVKEETNLNVIQAKPLFFSEVRNSDTHVCVYEVIDYDGDIVVTEEGDVKWVDWETVESGSYGDFNRDLHNHIIRQRRGPSM